MQNVEKLDDVLEKGTSKRIMTYNVWNVWSLRSTGPENKRSRIEGCATVIHENNPDFICLQEYDHCYRYHTDGLHFSLISEKYAEASLKDVDPSYVWNPIFYNKEKYSLIENGMVDFKEEGATTEEYKYAACIDERSHFRSLVWAVLEDNDDRSKYIVGSLHYSVNVDQHEAQAKLVIDKIKELCGRYDAVSLVCGDYNCLIPKNWNTDMAGCGVMAREGFKDTYLLADDKNDVASANKLGEVATRSYADYGIDHVMTLSDIKVEAYCTLNTERIRQFSDHNPVVVQFS